MFYDLFLFSENKQGVEGYVEKALKRRIERKVQEIDEYRASTLFAKTINHQLHEKMVDAEKQRSDALYKDLPSDFFESDDISDFSFLNLKRKNSKESKKKRGSSNLLQVPGMQRRRSSIGMGRAGPIPFLEYDETNAKLQINAFREAFKILMKEYETRKEVRARRRAAKLKAKNRILAAWAFRKKQEESKKLNAEKEEKKEKLERSLGIYSSKKDKSDANKYEKDEKEGSIENATNEDSDISKSNVSEINEDRTVNTDDTPNKDSEEKHIKRSIELVDFRKDRLNIKKSQRKAGNRYYLKNDKEDWTKDDHLNFAQNNLLRVQEQYRKINNIEMVEDVVEEQAQRNVPKFKDIVLKVMRINSVKNAFAVRKPSVNEKELDGEEQECNDEGIVQQMHLA